VRIHTLRIIGVLAAATLAVTTAACGKGSTPAGSVNLGAVDVAGCKITISLDTSTQPTVSIDSGTACATPPEVLSVADVVPGTGPAAKAGDSMVVRYYGEAWSTQTSFDSSWKHPAGQQQFTVAPLGQASVIVGWNEGLIGAQAGARRLLVIPPGEGYGANGAGDQIGPNETLIFVVDVVSIGPYTPPPPSPSASASP
jgi:peptidylprolyl isomerase